MTGLCRVSMVRNILGNDDPEDTQSYDYIIEAYITATSEMVENYCALTIIRPATAVQEYHDGNDDYYIYLKEVTKRVPLDTSLTFALYEVLPDAGGGWSATAIDTDNYRVFSDGQVEYKAKYTRGNRNYRADYFPGFDNTGWDTAGLGDTASDTFAVPPDLEKAVAHQVVINLKKAAGASPGADSRLGLINKSMGVESESINQYVTGLEEEVKLILDLYRRYNV